MQLEPSQHNIISTLKEGKQYLIVNVLSGNADIITRQEMQMLENPSHDVPAEFTEKGYLVNPDQEKIDFQLKYIDFLEERDQEEIQLFFVPSYACNFTCSYCYQSGYPKQQQALNAQITDAYFDFVLKRFENRSKYITLFGGEPLLAGSSHKENIQYFLEKAKQNKLQTAIVTNGFLVDEYIEMFDPEYIREIQITLDGTAQIHNQRRRLKNQEPTFDRIARNVDLCLSRNISVNLRMVVDKDNIQNLPELAEYAIQKGWTANPLFKTQIGRNYELHYCQNGPSILFDRLSLYQALLEIIKEHPHIVQFHKPAFSAMKFLEENGKLPNALFDACPACKSEWAMDYTGSIYSCTATVGKPGEKLGTFFPETSLDEQKIKVWQQRDVAHIEKCRSCNLQLICGGGCGSIAANQHGDILSPDCRPIAELNALGVEAYFGNK